MGYWWVNHSQAGAHEVARDYLWSPKREQGGARNQGYDNMALAQPGDIVFSHIDGVVGYVGVVTDLASESSKPAGLGKVGSYWSDDGWLLPVSFQPVRRPVVPKQHLDALVPELPKKYSPIQPNGHGNQKTYLAAISDVLARKLLHLTDADSVSAQPTDATAAAQVQADIEAIQKSTDLSETERQRLSNARIGQGLFRSLVLILHPVCKVTGMADKRLLRASHIKPWRDCTNTERLDGANGIMLSPHIDVLFDQGLISFENDGRMLVREDLAPEVLAQWSIPADLNLAPFHSSQWGYLAWHRQQLARAQA
jgi:hypothetical protein